MIKRYYHPKHMEEVP